MSSTVLPRLEIVAHLDKINCKEINDGDNNDNYDDSDNSKNSDALG